MKNKKGFTLIELLAVVIILGILMTVGGIAITRITENTRKSTFINTAQEYAEAVRTLWVGDSIFCGNKDFISSDVADGNYYVLIDSTDSRFSYLLEKNNKSPWGNRDLKGYVRVNVFTDAKGKKKIKYYVSITDGIHAIKDNKESDQIKKGDLEMDISNDKEKLESISKTPFDIGRLTTCGDQGLGTNKSPDNKVAEVISGDKNNLRIGDEIKIKDEAFNIISINGSEITMLSKYNLKVGNTCDNKKCTQYSENEKGYGMQDPQMRGWISDNNTVPRNGVSRFSSNGTEYYGSKAKEYVDMYKMRLEETGITILDARLIRKEEMIAMGCNQAAGTCSGAPAWFTNTTYWSETPINSVYMWGVFNNHKYMDGYLFFIEGSLLGIRPVVTINQVSIK